MASSPFHSSPEYADFIADPMSFPELVEAETEAEDIAEEASYCSLCEAVHAGECALQEDEEPELCSMCDMGLHDDCEGCDCHCMNAADRDYEPDASECGGLDCDGCARCDEDYSATEELD